MPYVQYSRLRFKNQKNSMMSREREKGGQELYTHFYTESHNLVDINLTL